MKPIAGKLDVLQRNLDLLLGNGTQSREIVLIGPIAEELDPVHVNLTDRKEIKHLAGKLGPLLQK